MKTVMSNEAGKEPQNETVELWELEKCTYPEGTPPEPRTFPEEDVLRCSECARPYRGKKPKNIKKSTLPTCLKYLKW